MNSQFVSIGEFKKTNKGIQEYINGTIHYWRVSFDNSIPRFIIQHLNLVLGFIFFYILLPEKAALYLKDFIAIVYFSLPVFLQECFSNMDALFSSGGYVSIRTILSTILASVISIWCPTMPRAVFKASMTEAIIVFFVYVLAICLLFTKQIWKALWYYLSPILSNAKKS